LKENLLKRLTDNEDNYTERKPETAGKSDWKRTLVAFANSVDQGNTGILFIGVEDNGTIKGVSNTDSLQKKIRKICKNECYPPIDFKSEVLSIEGSDVLAVSIGESSRRPHFAGPAYVREGSESVISSEDQYEDLIASRIDPCREILKHKGENITVVVHRKRLGETKHLGDNRYRAAHKCRVEKCSPHYVTLYDFNTKQTVTEPLKNITISFDHNKSRFQLNVEPNRAANIAFQLTAFRRR